MYGYTPSNTTWDAQLAATAEQITLASKGSFVRARTDVSTPSSFYNAPATERAAYLVAAYWLAIAARLGYTSVLSTANSFYQKAKSGTTFSSSDEAKRKAPLAQAIAALDTANAKKDRRTAGIYSALASGQSSERLALSDQLTYEQSTRGILTETAKASASDVGKTLTTGAYYLTGKKPPDEDPTVWWFKKNAFRLAIVGGVGLLAYLYLKPLLAPLKRVQAATVKAGERMADKAEARLSRIARNPRRRRAARRR